MSNVFSSGIFCYRNVGKTENGEWGRAPVALGQAKNVLYSIMEYDNAVGKGAKSAVAALEKASKSDKLLEAAGKGVNYASKHINPLICVSGGIKVLSSDDPATALVQEACSLKAMFTGENFMKQNMDKFPALVKNCLVKASNKKCIGKMAQGILNFFAKNKILCGKFAPVAKGVAFVGGSMLSYEVGHKFGTVLTNSMGLSKKS